GAIFTDDKALAERINSYKIHGKGTFKYDNVRIGMNSRLDTIQAAILQVKLKAFIDYELDAVNQVARWYSEALKDTAIKTPQIPEGYLSSWAQYVILLPEGTNQDKLQEALKSQGYRQWFII
ncbi:MAG: DegT/DnrJ/EryC1/StrS family aminotransferase, partial [Eubacterium sp.]